MTRILFSIFLLASVSASAQTITVNDTISSGDKVVYYVADTNATNMAGTTGPGVTWDYSTLAGYGISNLDTVIDAADSPFGSDFPMASYNEDFENGVKTFFSNTEDSVIVNGFVFQEQSNDIIIVYDDDPLTTMKFDMSQGESYTDYLEGSAILPFVGTVDITGTATVEADGSGTLLVGAATFSNVLRIKVVENINGTASGQPFTVTRTVYSYYDMASNTMPIFMHATIFADLGLIGTYGYQAVYSAEPLTGTGFVGLEETEELTFSVYPNPANDVVRITAPEKTEQISITNIAGQVVYSTYQPVGQIEINVANFPAGVYFVKLEKGSAVVTEKLVIR